MNSLHSFYRTFKSQLIKDMKDIFRSKLIYFSIAFVISYLIFSGLLESYQHIGGVVYCLNFEGDYAYNIFINSYGVFLGSIASIVFFIFPVISISEDFDSGNINLLKIHKGSVTGYMLAKFIISISAILIMLISIGFYGEIVDYTGGYLPTGKVLMDPLYISILLIPFFLPLLLTAFLVGTAVPNKIYAFITFVFVEIGADSFVTLISENYKPEILHQPEIMISSLSTTSYSAFIPFIYNMNFGFYNDNILFERLLISNHPFLDLVYISIIFLFLVSMVVLFRVNYVRLHNRISGEWKNE